MKLSKFLPVFIAAMVIGFGGFVLAGDAFAGCVSGAYGEPCLPDRPSRTPPIFKPPPTYVPTTPSPQELERQRKERERQREANDLNKRGVEYYKKGHWATAVDYFSRALELYPDSVIRQNLLNAEKEVERVAAERERDRELDELQEQEEKLADEAAKKAKEKIHQGLDDFSAELGSSRAPKGPLTLMGPRKPLFARGAKASSTGGLQFMDPRQEGRDCKGVDCLEGFKGMTPHERHKDPRVDMSPGIRAPGAGKAAGAQLKSAAISGRASTGAPTEEKAHEEATLTFGKLGYKASPLPASTVYGQAPEFYSKSPLVTDEDRKRIPSIVGFEKQRAQAINKLAVHEAKLEKLRSLPVNKRPKDWSVQRFKAINAKTKAKSEIGAADAKIGDALRLNKGKAERKAEVKRTPIPPPPPKTEKPKKKGNVTWELD